MPDEDAITPAENSRASCSVFLLIAISYINNTHPALLRISLLLFASFILFRFYCFLFFFPLFSSFVLFPSDTDN